MHCDATPRTYEAIGQSGRGSSSSRSWSDSPLALQDEAVSVSKNGRERRLDDRDDGTCDDVHEGLKLGSLLEHAGTDIVVERVDEVRERVEDPAVRDFLNRMAHSTLQERMKDGCVMLKADQLATVGVDAVQTEDSLKQPSGELPRAAVGEPRLERNAERVIHHRDAFSDNAQHRLRLGLVDVSRAVVKAEEQLNAARSVSSGRWSGLVQRTHLLEIEAQVCEQACERARANGPVNLFLGVWLIRQLAQLVDLALGQRGSEEADRLVAADQSVVLPDLRAKSTRRHGQLKSLSRALKRR